MDEANPFWSDTTKPCHADPVLPWLEMVKINRVYREVVVRLGRPARVLDVGCGETAKVRLACPGANYTGIDPYPRDIDVMCATLREAFHTGIGPFDLIVCCRSLSNVGDPLEQSAMYLQDLAATDGLVLVIDSWAPARAAIQAYRAEQGFVSLPESSSGSVDLPADTANIFQHAGLLPCGRTELAREYALGTRLAATLLSADERVMYWAEGKEPANPTEYSLWQCWTFRRA